MSHKMGFWAVFAIVTGSQIGSGVFLLPASLARYGMYGLLGWIASAGGAIALALVFASLCARYPQTGGPHVYVRQAFGDVAAFFTGWTYWVISWVSTSILVIASITYLTPLIGQHAPMVYFVLEVALLLAIMMLNLRGVESAGKAEIFLTFLKFVPLTLIPLAALWFFDSSNLMLHESVASLSLSKIMGQTALLTLWGFIGLEAATAPAGSVENPSKTIPRAVVFGTAAVAALYLLNSIGIMGLIPGNVLMHSQAPYADAVQLMFGGYWHLLMALMASLICIGALNAWILVSGQVSLGLAEDKFLPPLFAKKNNYGAPVWGLVISCVAIIPLLFLTMNENLVQQVTDIIDFSVTAFLFVYLMCAVGFMKMLIQQKIKAPHYQSAACFVAIAFCSWVIYETPLHTLGVAGLFVASALPMYLFWYRRA